MSDNLRTVIEEALRYTFVDKGGHDMDGADELVDDVFRIIEEHGGAVVSAARHLQLRDALLAELRGAHVYDNSDGFSRCLTCRMSWPCPTAQVLAEQGFALGHRGSIK